MKKILFEIFVACLLINVFFSQVFAQESSYGIAISIEKGVGDFNEGRLVCSGEGGFKLCNQEYDTAIYGVVVGNPAASIEQENLEEKVLVQTSGIAKVSVIGSRGPIKRGDYITASEKAGYGQHAEETGYVLGMALDEFTPDSPESEGSVLVALNIHAATGVSGVRSNLLGALKRGLSAGTLSPLDTLRYLLAALIVITSFTVGFAYFGKASGLGIEAIGRNPLASRKIEAAVLVHLMITIVVFLVGLSLAYLILIL